MSRNTIKLVLAAALFFVFGLAASPTARAQSVPHYKLDPSWPKVLPNNWIMANATGLVIDKDDHIWVVHRPRMVAADDAAAALTPPQSACCVPAPSVIEFDTQGNVLKSFGGPGWVPEWPTLEHGLFIDRGGNFWIAGNYLPANRQQLTAPPRPKEDPLDDRHLFKISPDQKVLLQIGHPSNAAPNNQDTSMLGAPSEMYVDDDAHEVFIADGYLNRRVVVYDSETGAFKRGWGAYGIPLSQIDNGRLPPHDDPAAPPSKQFRGPVISLDISSDGLVYVGDGGGDRVQIFTKDGKFVKEYMIRSDTLAGFGSVWGTTFSRDKQQKYLYVSDGGNGMIHILNRADGTEVSSFGHKGREPGQFDSCERLALDSHGALYVTEVNHNTRMQKFVPVK
jgi:hypothetical protein